MKNSIFESSEAHHIVRQCKDHKLYCEFFTRIKNSINFCQVKSNSDNPSYFTKQGMKHCNKDNKLNNKQ